MQPCAKSTVQRTARILRTEGACRKVVCVWLEVGGLLHVSPYANRTPSSVMKASSAWSGVVAKLFNQLAVVVHNRLVEAQSCFSDALPCLNKIGANLLLR